MKSYQFPKRNRVRANSTTLTGKRAMKFYKPAKESSMNENSSNLTEDKEIKKHNPKKLQLVDSRRFTLIELMIVISIIAILAAMLLPLFQRTMDYARSIDCKGRLKQCALANLLYVNDFDGYICPNANPGSSEQKHWYFYIMDQCSYFESVDLVFCPEQKTISRTAYSRQYGYGSGVRDGYFKINNLPNKIKATYYPLVADSSHKSYNSSYSNPYLGLWQVSSYEYASSTPYTVTDRSCIFKRHSQGNLANIAFGDGHVESFNNSIIEKEPYIWKVGNKAFAWLLCGKKDFK